MSFNKKYIPELEKLKLIRESYNDDKEFLRVYLYKPDALIGSDISMQYLEDLHKKINGKH